MLEQAINYPRNSENALRTIVIGGVLTLLGFLVVPLFFVYGYLMDVLRSGMDRSEEPPGFDEWEDLLVEGVKAFAITFVYFLIPLAIFAVTVGGALISVLSGNAGAGTVLGALAGFTVASIVSLVFYYVVPAALANFARSGEIASAFAFGELRPVLFSGSYAKGWLLALAVIIVAGVVTSLLNVVPLLGFVAGVFVTFYAGVAAFYIYGQAFEDASRPPAAPESPASQPAA